MKLSDPVEIDVQWSRIVLDGDIPDPPRGRLIHAQTMVSLIEIIAPVYASAHWDLVWFKRKHLFTSDNPVCFWREPDGSSGIGLLTADIVSIALDHSTGLAIVPKIQES